MLSVATTVRQKGLPPGALRFLATKGLHFADCAVVFLETASYMLGVEYGVRGILVSPDHRIFEFELELDESLSEVLQVVTFEEVTDQWGFSNHNAGTGKGRGSLAVDVLSELSGT